ncbi:hypothetical protein Cni_G24190 [Canna indica]|uniref:Uncharacterized protein n=1 Tax=Canna indica TaxID=4628 RepID=A0AAQ3KVF5_9LILI|nr:hypothetical protein Cni_G24190 [Canna indica]
MSTIAAADLPSPFSHLGVSLFDVNLRETAYEIFVAASHTTDAKPPLTSPSPSGHPPPSTALPPLSLSLSLNLSPSPSLLQRWASLSRLIRGSGRGCSGLQQDRLGKRLDHSMVLPLEFLQQFKALDFPDHQEYEAWQCRNLKIDLVQQIEDTLKTLRLLLVAIMLDFPHLYNIGCVLQTHLFAFYRENYGHYMLA